jgi:hypothetical protein
MLGAQIADDLFGLHAKPLLPEYNYGYFVELIP